jgi:hypothetical protein
MSLPAVSVSRRLAPHVDLMGLYGEDETWAQGLS